MKILHITLWAVAATSLAVGSTVLRAQPSASDNDEVTAPIEKKSDLSPTEMNAASESHLKDMQTILVRIVDLQKLARKQKDVIKLNCVNDKLLQVKQLLNIAETSRTDLVEAIARQDQASTLHQFSQVSIAKENSEGLRNEAEGCIGEELIFLGPTEISVNDPGLQDDPTGGGAMEWNDILEAPGYATPFL